MSTKRFEEFRHKIEKVNRDTKALLENAPEFLRDVLVGSAREAQLALVQQYQPKVLLRQIEEERVELKQLIATIEDEVRKMNDEIGSMQATTPDMAEAETTLQTMRDMHADEVFIMSFEKKLNQMRKAHAFLEEKLGKLTRERDQKVAELAELRNERARMTMPAIDFLSDEDLTAACSVTDAAQDYSAPVRRSVSVAENRKAATSKVDTPHTLNASERVVNVLVKHAHDKYLYGLSQAEINKLAYSEPSLKKIDRRSGSLLYLMLNGTGLKALEYMQEHAPGMVLQVGSRKVAQKRRTLEHDRKCVSHRKES